MVHIPKTPAPASPPPLSVPTSADVARLAGVSRATVSYVLNNTRAVRISEPTRQRVREAAEELGYVPHAAARSLRAGHSRLVLIPAPSVPVSKLYGPFINELQWALSRLDYTVVQHGGVGLDGDEAARAWAELRPVAVLVPGTHISANAVAVLRRSGVRAVVTLGPEPVEGAHALLMDHAAVGHAAARHLYERGRRRIGVVVPEEGGMEAFALPRLAGAREALEGTDATVTHLPLACTEEACARLADRWERLGLDGVFAYNDEYALLVLRALQDADIDVPGDVSLIGADDLVVGRLVRPRLSTVHVGLPAARDLAALVDRTVRHPGSPLEAHKVLDATVVPRDST